MNWKLLRACLRGLSAFRPLLETPVLGEALALLDAVNCWEGEQALEVYHRLFYRLKSEGYSGLGDWLWDALRYTETPYGTAAGMGSADPALEGAARRDVEALLQLARVDVEDCRAALSQMLGEEFAPVLAALPAWEAGAPFTFEELADFYRKNGAGL